MTEVEEEFEELSEDLQNWVRETVAALKKEGWNGQALTCTEGETLDDGSVMMYFDWEDEED